MAEQSRPRQRYADTGEEARALKAEHPDWGYSRIARHIISQRQANGEEAEFEQVRFAVRWALSDLGTRHHQRRAVVMQAGRKALAAASDQMEEERQRWASILPKFKPGAGVRRTLVLSDIEFPYQRSDLSDILQDYKGWDELVAAGDCLHLAQFSPFRNGHTTRFMDDLEEFYGWVKAASEWFTWVKLMLGNHDHRLARMLLELCRGSEALDIMEIDVLSIFVAGFSRRIHVGEGRFEYRRYSPIPNVIYPRSWLIQQGDVVILHPMDKPFKHLVNYYGEWDDTLRSWAENLEYSALLFGHTHRYFRGRSRDGRRRLWSAGAVSGGYSYLRSGKRWRDPEQGYIELVQRDGVTDWSQTRIIELPAIPPARPLTEVELRR